MLLKNGVENSVSDLPTDTATLEIGQHLAKSKIGYPTAEKLNEGNVLL